MQKFTQLHVKVTPHSLIAHAPRRVQTVLIVCIWLVLDSFLQCVEYTRHILFHESFIFDKKLLNLSNLHKTT